MNETLGINNFGTLTLGMTVGFVLAYGLLLSGKPQVKAAITVVGCALGGVPLAFVKMSGALWIYPVGLLIGFLAIRIMSARAAIAAKYAKPTVANQVHGWFAWIDLVIITIFVFGSVAYTLIIKDAT